MTALSFMGLDEPETFRCRVYVSPEHDAQHDAAAAFVRQLASGWVETEDGDPRHGAIAALLERGYVKSMTESAKEHGLAASGLVRVWTLTPRGRAELLP